MNAFCSGHYTWKMVELHKQHGKYPLWGPLLSYITEKTGDKSAIDFFSFLNDMLVVTRDTLSLFSTPAVDDEVKDERSIIQALVQSNLRPDEKKLMRVYDDVRTVTGAAFETPAAAMRLILFYVYSNPTILKKLRTDLASVAPQEPEGPVFDLTSLEQLPYLTAVITEGLRLSPGVAARQARNAPNRELVYDK
ncbi:cytochrome P450 [Hypoxylon cercidicola]|nr:cytochrome P450 [Hypoxylon cercidicola]